MSAEDLPMMPFWVKDWIAATAGMSHAWRGAYISLLAYQWVNGSVPRDVSQLARISGCTEIEFEQLWIALGSKFDEAEEGLFNLRLEEHRREALRRRAGMANGASMTNEKRRARKAIRLTKALESSHDSCVTPGVTHTSTSTSSEEESKKEIPPSDTPPKRSAYAKRILRGTYDLTVDDQWLTFKIAYPCRAGGQPWRAAMKCWRARIAEGHEAEEIIAGTERYAAWISATDRERTEFVMQAKTFLGPDKHFLSGWELPREAANDERWSPPSDDLDEVAHG